MDNSVEQAVIISRLTINLPLDGCKQERYWPFETHSAKHRGEGQRWDEKRDGVFTDIRRVWKMTWKIRSGGGYTLVLSHWENLRLVLDESSGITAASPDLRVTEVQCVLSQARAQLEPSEEFKGGDRCVFFYCQVEKQKPVFLAVFISVMADERKSVHFDMQIWYMDTFWKQNTLKLKWWNTCSCLSCLYGMHLKGFSYVYIYIFLHLNFI